MNERRLKFSILGVSVALHAGFLLVSGSWWMPGPSTVIERAHQMFRVKPVDLPKPRDPRRQIIQGYARSLQFQDPSAAMPASTLRFQSPREDKIESPTKGTSTETPVGLAKSGSLMPLQEPTAREKVVVVRRKVKARFSVPEGKPEVPESLEGEGALEVPEPFLQKMFAFTPESATAGAVKAFPSGTNERGFTGKGKFGSLDEFMALKVSTWRDPKGGPGYFEIAIRPGKDAAKLAHMPKELVFLLDSSLSIRGYRMDEFKKGIVYCLRNLNAGDRANLMSFKDTTRLFAEDSRAPDAGLVGDAIRFLGGVEASERTDIYAALGEVIRRKPAVLPSYVVLLSDGRPTEGITSSTRLIEEATRANARTRSIFTFSGGRRVNRYLLDFLAYQNRGWSEYAVNGMNIRAEMQDFYDKIRDPLLMNLRYRFGQIDENEMYPKHLPDFFRNAEFVLYGMYDAEKPFSMQILGDIGGETKEVIFAGDLAKAEHGTRDIAVAWAFNKVYHLIGRMTAEGPAPELKAQIQDLARRFDIRTPYDLAD